MKKIICLSFGIASFFMSNHYCAAMDHPEQLSNDEVLAFKMQFQEIAEGYQQNEQASDSDEDLKLALRLQMEELDQEIQLREEEEEELSEEESSADNLSNLETDGQEEEEVAADLPNNPVTSDQEEVSTTDNLTHSETNIQEAAEPAVDVQNNEEVADNLNNLTLEDEEAEFERKLAASLSNMLPNCLLF